MKFRTCAIALAALLATGLGFDRAHADVDCTASSQWTTASGCPSSKRVLAADTTCLTGGTDVEIVDGEARRTVSVQNECSDHGQIVAHVERVEADDLMICLGSAELTTVSVPAVTAVSCCFEGEEDLCFEDQVEADANGKIKRRTVGSPTAVTEVDVSTHLRRWHFCQDFPDDVYCKVNPSGDALTMPAHAACGGEGQPACNCGNHLCIVDDCDWHFEQSEAAETCAGPDSADHYLMTISATDGSSQSCTIATLCGQEGRNWTDRGRPNVLTAEVWHIDDLRDCNGTLKVGDCD